MVGLTHGLDQVQRLRVVGHHHNTLARLMEGRCKGVGGGREEGEGGVRRDVIRCGMSAFACSWTPPQYARPSDWREWDGSMCY